MLCTWLFTVYVAMLSRCAISLLLSPSAIKSVICCSRFVIRTDAIIGVLRNTEACLAMCERRVPVSAGGTTSPPLATWRIVLTSSSSAASFAMNPFAPRLMKSMTSSSSGSISIMMMRACGAASFTLSTNRWLRLRPNAASTRTTLGLCSSSRCSADDAPSADATTLKSVCESRRAARPSRNKRLSSMTRI